MTRRTFLLGAAGVTVASIGGTAIASSMLAPSAPGPVWPAEPIALGSITVRPIRTGSVAVKRVHQAYGGPVSLVFPALVVDPRWTPWLPITCWLIEHPDGPIMVDTGETAKVHEAGYFGCDAGVQFVYERLLRFDVPAPLEVGAQLRELGIPPEEIGTVALTHLHSDHAGGLHHFPNATFYTSQQEAVRPPQGALPCRWPAGFRPTPVEYSDGPWGAFPTSKALTQDGRVRLIPTPGHTWGHQSVLVEENGQFVLLAGDASFSRAQVDERVVAGICERPRKARYTLDLIAEHLQAFPDTAYLASHAAENLEPYSAKQQ
ncbi:MAG: N-acyl homoserine lactonase family protein [Bacteroidota bacterium]